MLEWAWFLRWEGPRSDAALVPSLRDSRGRAPGATRRRHIESHGPWSTVEASPWPILAFLQWKGAVGASLIGRVWLAKRDMKEKPKRSSGVTSAQWRLVALTRWLRREAEFQDLTANLANARKHFFPPSGCISLKANSMNRT